MRSTLASLRHQSSPRRGWLTVLGTLLLLGCGDSPFDVGPTTARMADVVHDPLTVEALAGDCPEASDPTAPDADGDGTPDACEVIVTDPGTITAQADLDAIAGVTEIEGTLRVQGAGITDLSPLSALQQVRGSLEIVQTSASLDALAALRVVENELYLYELPAVDLSEIADVDSIGQLSLYRLPATIDLNNVGVALSLDILFADGSLASLDGMPAGVEKLILHHTSLTTLDGVQDPSSLDLVALFRNAALEDLSALSAMTTASRVLLTENPLVTDLTGFSGLSSTEELGIHGMSGLTDLSGLAALSSATSVSIRNNPSLETLAGFAPEGAMRSFLTISDNPVLHDISSLAGISAVWGLAIVSNDALESLAGLEGIVTVDNHINVIGNESLVDLSGLSSLNDTRLNGPLQIRDNASLTDITALAPLSHVGEDLAITGNAALPTLAGLEAMASVGRDLDVVGNPVLNDCSALDDLLANDGVVGTVTIADNGPGCGPPDADTDGDGVPDTSDICPGFDDSSDLDGDAAPDGCDAFPTDPGESVDTDGDGVGDNRDFDPNDPNVSALPYPAPSRIAAGYDFSCALATDGKIDCWGENGLGQAAPPSASGFVQVSAGSDFACAVHEGGAATCWGNNTSGQAMPPLGVSFRKVSAGQGGHACGLTMDDTVTCWGSDFAGSVSDAPEGGVYVDVSAGANFSCAVPLRSEVQCWGYGGHGQLEVFGFGEWPAGQVDAGGDFACAVGPMNQGMGCWGQFAFDLGGSALQVSAGVIHFCWIDPAGQASCGGSGSLNRLTPPAGVTFIQLSAGGTHTCGITSTHEIECWGDNDAGQLDPVNFAPEVTSVILPADPVAVGTSVSLSALFTDANTGDTHTGAFDWGAGSVAAFVTESGGSGSIALAQRFESSGVYSVEAIVSDGDLEDRRPSLLDEPGYLVVYDPAGSFVTGGGWIDSPAGACAWNDCTLGTTGKANFGFVAKYRQGSNVPTGETQFRFKAGDLDFRSVHYDWLVVAGARAKFKGVGQVDGEGEFGFMLTGVDGDEPGGGGVDRFRIKVWDVATGEVVYDNQRGEDETSDAATALGGGSIQIHK